jgi:hypothetical protein
MTFGYYTYILTKPEEITRHNYQEHHRKMNEMVSWIHEQRWDHWGSVPGGIYFNVEENYNWFVLRWGAP